MYYNVLGDGSKKFCGVRERNVPKVITHVQTIGLLIKPYCSVANSLL